jgi:WD40 repeat protein
MLLRKLDKHLNRVQGIAISADSQRIASASQDWKVMIWDIDTGEHMHTLEGHTHTVFTVDFSNDGTLLCSGGGGVEPSYDNYHIIVWSLCASACDGGPEEVQRLQGHRDVVSCVRFSHDGSRIVSASHDKTLIIWHVQSGEQMVTYRGHRGEVCCAAWSKDSKVIASGGFDDDVHVWDAVTPTHAFKLKGHGKAVTSLAFGSEDDILVTGTEDKGIHVWHLPLSHQPVLRHVFKGSFGHVCGISLSPRDACVAIGSTDMSVRACDVATGQQRGALRGHSDAVNSVAWSRDGRYVVSGSSDGSLGVWDATVLVRALTRHVMREHVCLCECLCSCKACYV